MEIPRYSDVYGELHGAREVNNHHVIHTRRKYCSPLEKKYLQVAGFVVPLLISVHKNLHAEVAPPIKPHPDIMRATVQYAATLDRHESVYDRFINITDRLEALDAPHRLVDNLRMQAPFILEGQVQRV